MSVDLSPDDDATATAPAPRPARRWLTALCWTASAAVAVWAVARGFDLDPGRVVQLLAFTPYVAGGSVVVAVAVLALRRWWAGALAMLAALSLVTTVAPRALPDADRGAADGPALTVMTANVLTGLAEPEELLEMVREHEVDVLAVQEFTPALAAALDARGIAALLPYRQLNAEPGTTGSGIFARHPLSDGGTRIQASHFTQSYATMTAPGAPPVLVESAHPLAPWGPTVIDDWREDLAAEPRATPDGPVRLLLGDFNATLDHAPLRDLIASGYRDAADVDGTGLVGTWGPYDGDPIPPVTIDHVLVDRRIRVDDVRVRGIPGSDHRAIVADLVLPKAA